MATFNELGTGGVVCNSTAILSVRFGKIATGGVVVAGLATPLCRLNISGTGGVVAGTSASIKLTTSKTASGGVRLSGTSFVYRLYPKTVSGGLKTNGTSTNYVSRTIRGDGGVCVAGKTLIADTLPVGGGVRVAGTTSPRTFFNVQGTGGFKASGTNSQTFKDYYNGLGGIRAGGRARVEKITHRGTITRTGAGRAISGSILAVVPSEQSQLIQPVFIPDVVVDDDPRQELNGVWCPIDESCVNGASLASVMLTRQKGYLPDPEGTLGPTGRGIATES